MSRHLEHGGAACARQSAPSPMARLRSAFLSFSEILIIYVMCIFYYYFYIFFYATCGRPRMAVICRLHTASLVITGMDKMRWLNPKIHFTHHILLEEGEKEGRTNLEGRV